MVFQTFKSLTKVSALTLLLAATTLMATGAQAQSTNGVDLQEIRWKSESHVRSVLGEPNSVTGPVGTHASYTLWQYDSVTVAFANQRVFHMFDKNSLRKMELEENR